MSFTVGIATKTQEEADAYRYDILDLTKDWPDAEYHEASMIIHYAESICSPSLTGRPHHIDPECRQLLR